MFSNSKSILVQPIQRDDLILNEIDCRLIDIQQKITDLLSAGYVIYDVSASTNSNFNNLIASSSGNRICVWKSVGSTAYTIYSTELASNGTNVIINATLNNMNQVTAIRDCKLTCSGSSFANKAEFYGGDWYLASWTTGSNVKFTNCNVYAYSSEVYMPDVNFEYCNVSFKRSGTIAYSTYKVNTETRFVNATTAGSTTATLTLSYAYTTDSDWFTRCTLVDWQNTGTAVLSSTASRTFNFNGLKIENSNLTVTNLYTTEGNKIYYEGQDLVLSGSLTAFQWNTLGHVSSSSGAYPSIAFDQSGVPYVAFQDNANSDKASCYKYGSTGWQVVGYVGFSSNSMDYINIHISTSNDKLIIGRDNSSKAIAYSYNVSNSSWVLIGSFSTNPITSLKSTPYVGPYVSAFVSVVTINSSSNSQLCDYYLSPSYSTTATFSRLNWYSNYSTSPSNYNFNLIDAEPVNWNGNSGIISVSSSSPNIINYFNYIPELGSIRPTVIFSTYVNFVSTVGNITKLFSDKTGQVSDFNEAFITSSSIINYLQINLTADIYGHNAPTSTPTNYGTVSTGSVQNASIQKINSIPYVAIEDTTAKATVYKYVAANSSWNLVGTANFSTNNTGRLQLASYNNDPYVVLEETGVATNIGVYYYGEVVTNSNINYSFENLETDIFDGDKTLDITTIQSTANYIVQNCKVSPGYNIVDTAVGRFIRNTYNINLAPGWNPPVDDALKETNADTFWVVKREDIEATLNGKIIKNLKLYDSGLSLYNYKSNDNFIIIANNATKGNAVFCFYNNKIKGTVFSDQYLDVAYTITDCIILMEPNEISELSHVVSSTALADGPLEQGNIVFNSYDNEIIN